MYLNSNWDGERNSDDDGWTVGLNYKGAQASDAGSYGIFARYYDQGEGTYWEHTTDANTFWNTGFKGYAVAQTMLLLKTSLLLWPIMIPKPKLLPVKAAV